MKVYKLLRRSAVISSLVLFTFLSCETNNSGAHTEILWDHWGVPHIYAENTTDMYYAFGRAQMESHADLILKLYAEARGRAGEYFGEGYLETDQRVRLFNIPDSSAVQYNRYTGEEKEYLDAFVRGLNDYAKSNSSKISKPYKDVLPVTAIDVIAHGKRVMNLEFLGGSEIRKALNDLKSISSETDNNEIKPGSNSYAISPIKSESGNAMLVANPHLPWSEFYLFYEAHLNAPGFNVYGTTLVGMPILNIAFNEHLGWTHTVNTIDASDRYELTLADDGYLLDGEKKLFEEKKVIIKVLNENGSLEENEFTLRYSEHGPVVGEADDKAIALRIAGFENYSYYLQYHRMGMASNFDEFTEALHMMQIPMFNLIYADRDGNIMYLSNGNIPARDEGNWSFWDGIVDGTRSDLIWDGYHSFEDLPVLVNPETGFVQNANDAPWTSTYPVLLNPDEYPSYMSPQPEELPTSMRAQRAINLIKNDNSISFDELINYKLDTGMEIADRFLNDLLEAVNTHSDPLAQKAAEVLTKWDKDTNTYSRGAVLFSRWFDKLSNDMFSIPWNSSNPVTTPSGLKDPQKAVNLLKEAALEVENEYGSMDIAWGDINRFKVGDIEFPANGGHSRYGVFRTMFFQPDEQNNKSYVFHGDTYVAVIEFGDTVRAQALLSYGNATQPGNRFAGDQLQMLSENRLRKVLLSKEEVLENLFKREVL